MKALSLTQPWATLIAIDAKRIETRSWETLYRGPLAIHAAAGLGLVGGKKGLTELCAREPFHSVLDRLWQPPGTFWAPASLPFGAIVATAYLVACERTDSLIGTTQLYTRNANGHPQFWELDEEQRAFGDYSPGRFAWLLCDIKPLPEPISAKGALGLWDWQPPEGFTP
jgi:hypothetical protein